MKISDIDDYNVHLYKDGCDRCRFKDFWEREV